MSDYAYMPFSDYEDACDAIRAKTETTDSIKSGEMAAKIQSISGGSQTKAANILNGVGLNDGYLSTTGVPQPQDGTKLEVYTDEIDVSANVGQTLNLYVFTQISQQQWLGCCFFDANHAIVGQRQNIQAGPMKGAVFDASVPSGAKYVRFSWRTYGNARYAASVGDAVYNAVGEDGFSVYPEVSNNA